jgi:AcrR family transcriptional regulator
MARILKEYEIRRNEILDAAQGLFIKKGYQNTSVNDILTKVGIAKGTFYHYFETKEDLLEGLAVRWTDELMSRMEKIGGDAALTAAEKLRLIFHETGNFRVVDRSYVLALGRMVFADANLLLRHKLVTRNIERMAPMLTGVIRQGMLEGVFQTEYPEEAAEMILIASFEIKERMGARMFDFGKDEEVRDLMRRRFKFWGDMIERLLGAPGGIVRDEVDRFLAGFFNGDGGPAAGPGEG